MRRRRLIMALAIVGLAGCGSTNAVNNTLPPRSTAPEPTSRIDIDDEALIQIAALDAVWPDFKDRICPAYREAIPDGQRLTLAERRYVISLYEQGAGDVAPAAEDHLIDLLQSC